MVAAILTRLSRTLSHSLVETVILANGINSRYAQERALKGGMRGVGFAALLGLDDFRKDAFATGYHAWLLQRKYPHAEIAFSCPRLRPIINNDKINPKDVHETQLCQILCAYRIYPGYRFPGKQ